MLVLGIVVKEIYLAHSTQSNLRNVLLEEYVEEYFKLEAEFKSVFAEHIVQEDCLLKIRSHLEKMEKKLQQRKFKKLRKFCKKGLRATRVNFLVLNIISIVFVSHLLQVLIIIITF